MENLRYIFGREVRSNKGGSEDIKEYGRNRKIAVSIDVFMYLWMKSTNKDHLWLIVPNIATG